MLEKFYHSTIRKAVVAFGNLFNGMYIDRQDGNGIIVQTIKVPFSYSPRQKFLARIETITDADTKKDIQVILPRMAFDMLSINYDPQRRVSYLQQSRTLEQSGSVANRQYAASPYNVNMGLYFYVKNQDDGLQILEQILPYFNPDFNLSVNAVPELGIKNDLAVILDSISYEDLYEGDFQTRRSIIWTLNFTLKLNFYGPISKQGIIKRVEVDYFRDRALSQKIQRYSVVGKGPDEAVEQGNDGNHVTTEAKIGSYSYEIGKSNTTSKAITVTGTANVEYHQELSFYIKLDGAPSEDTVVLNFPDMGDGEANKGFGISANSMMFFDVLNTTHERQRRFQESPAVLDDGEWHYIQLQKQTFRGNMRAYNLLIDGSVAGSSELFMSGSLGGTPVANNSISNSLINILNTNNGANIYIDDISMAEQPDNFALVTSPLPTEPRTSAANSIGYAGFELASANVATDATQGNVTQFVETFEDF